MMEDQPDPILYQIVSNLPMSEFPRICRVNRQMYGVCRRRIVEEWVRRFSSPQQALVAAARDGKLGLVKLLVETGVDPAWRDWQTLDMAIYNRHTPVAQYILSRAPDPPGVIQRLLQHHLRNSIEARNFAESLNVSDADLLQFIQSRVVAGDRLSTYLHAYPELTDRIPADLLSTALSREARELIRVPGLLARLPTQKLLDLYETFQDNPFVLSFLILDQRLLATLSREELLTLLNRFRQEGLSTDQVLAMDHPLTLEEVARNRTPSRYP